MKAKFQLGTVVATPGALDALERNNQTPETFLNKHLTLDVGDLTLEDQEANTASVADGSRILSAFTLADDTRIWIITEACDDQGRREATTILLPEEY